MPENLIACNLYSYKQYREQAWEHLPQLGIRHIEIGLPPTGQIEPLQAKLQDSGLQVSSFMLPFRLDSEAELEEALHALETFPKFGTKVAFISVHAGEKSKEALFDRLRRLGEKAQRLGIKIGIETHPDLAHNGRVALETVQAIDHPAVGINFDTANIYFYNEGTDTVKELEPILPYVVSVHLKDTEGGYREFRFPSLGEGVVDFPRVFNLLNESGFYGPFTMELEGYEGEELTQDQTLKQVADSVAYLQRIGAMMGGLRET